MPARYNKKQRIALCRAIRKTCRENEITDDGALAELLTIQGFTAPGGLPLKKMGVSVQRRKAGVSFRKMSGKKTRRSTPPIESEPVANNERGNGKGLPLTVQAILYDTVLTNKAKVRMIREYERCSTSPANV